MKIGGMDPIPEVANWPNPLPSSQCDEEDFFSIPSAQHKRGQVISGFSDELKDGNLQEGPRCQHGSPNTYGIAKAKDLWKVFSASVSDDPRSQAGQSVRFSRIHQQLLGLCPKRNMDSTNKE